MATLSSRLIWEHDRTLGLTSIYLDGAFLASGPELTLRRLLYGHAGLADTLTAPKEATK